MVASLLAFAAFLQRDNAEENAALAVARRIVLEAEKNLAVDPELSMLLALESIEASRSSGLEPPLSSVGVLREGAQGLGGSEERPGGVSSRSMTGGSGRCGRRGPRGLLGLGANVGRPVAMRQLMDAELGVRMSPKHAKLPGRATKMARHHHRVDCGRRPQGGDAAAPGGTRDGFEIEPDGWAVFSTDDLSTQLVC